MLLKAIEQHLRGDRSEPTGNDEELTLEHIMPEKWERNWPMPEGTSDREQAVRERNDATKMIGNLTLITKRLNSDMSNGAWESKQEDLARHSTLMLNKQFAGDQTAAWNENTIKERSKELTEKIIEIWPKPI